MARNKLKPYHLQVREKGQTIEYADLLNILYTNTFEDEFRDDLSNAPQTFIELFESYCDAWRTSQGAHVDDDLQKTLRVSQSDDELAVDYDNNLVEGIFRYGEYGERINTYDTETGETEEEVIQPEQAADTPYYFLLHIPEEEPEKAVIVLEERGNVGIKGRFQDAVQRKLPSGISQEMGNITDDSVYDTMRNASRIKKLVVETTESPHELGGQFGDAFSPSSTAKKMRYTATDDGSINLDVNELEDWMENDENPFTNVGGETYTKFKLTVESAGSQTTIDLFERSIGLSRNLEGVEREGGHPVPAFMSRKARQFVNQELLPSGASSIPTTSMLRGGDD